MEGEITELSHTSSGSNSTPPEVLGHISGKMLDTTPHPPATG